MERIIIGYIAFTSILPLLFGLQWVNPIIIYNNVSINWFGCIVLTILAHIAAGPWVVFYWFYKLCTVGRK